LDVVQPTDLKTENFSPRAPSVATSSAAYLKPQEPYPKIPSADTLDYKNVWESSSMLKKKTSEMEILKSRIRDKRSTAVNLEYSNSSTFVVQENVARMPAESPSTEGIVKSMRKRKKKK